MAGKAFHILGALGFTLAGIEITPGVYAADPLDGLITGAAFSCAVILYLDGVFS